MHLASLDAGNHGAADAGSCPDLVQCKLERGAAPGHATSDRKNQSSLDILIHYKRITSRIVESTAAARNRHGSQPRRPMTDFERVLFAVCNGGKRAVAGASQRGGLSCSGFGG